MTKKKKAWILAAAAAVTVIVALSALYFVNAVRLGFDSSDVKSVTIDKALPAQKKEITGREYIEEIFKAMEAAHIWGTVGVDDIPDGTYGYTVVFHLDDLTDREYTVMQWSLGGRYGSFRDMSADKEPRKMIAKNFDKLWDKLNYEAVDTKMTDAAN